MTEVSATELAGFSDCRRQWWLSQTWESKKPAPQFWIGRVVHAGLEGYFRGDRDYEKGLEYLDREITSSLRELEKDYPEVWSVVQSEFAGYEDLARGMFDNFCVCDLEDPLRGEIVSVETRLKTPVSSDITISGKIDLLVRRDDLLWIVDHKTSSSTTNFAGLDVDEQLSTYAWLVWKKYGEVPRGVEYNVLIKDLPKQPDRLKSGGFSKAKDQRTVYAIYRETLLSSGEDLSQYDEILTILKNKGWSSFFQRGSSTRNEEELRSFEIRAVRKASDIAGILTAPGRNAYPSPSNFKCEYCQFLSVCKSMEDGSDWQAQLASTFKKRKELKDKPDGQ